MKNIKELSKRELREYFLSIGEKSFRVNQVWKWLYQKLSLDFMEMTDLSLSLREKLKKDFYIGTLQLVESIKSEDNSEKFLWELEDGKRIESVLMYDKDRVTVCVSSQVGCALNCAFCATGKGGFERNLKTWEIAEQIFSIQRKIDNRITNIVYMGMGEPFLNYDNVIESADLINDDLSLIIGARHITISTAGIVEGIKKLSYHKKQYKLAVSLNSAIDEKRNKIMPINNRYNLKELKKYLKSYYARTRKRVTFEYVVFPGFNDSNEDMDALLDYIEDIPCKINLIPYNPVDDGLSYPAPSDKLMKKMVKYLHKGKWTITVRWSKGRDIKGGCGQLKARYKD